jgi:hypothetical protein
MANDYIDKITATDGITYDIKDTVSGYTTNTGTVTGMTTTAGSHTAGAQTVTNGIITTNIPTKTSHLTNDSGFITTDTQVTSTEVTAATTYYLTGSVSPATVTGGLNKHGAISAYVSSNTSTSGVAFITLGNPTASGTAGSKYGSIRLYGSTAYYTELRHYNTTNPTSDRFCYLPRYAGTQYLTCVSTASAVGGSSQATYVNNTGQIVAGNSFVPTTGGAFSGAVTAAASDGTTAQIANIKYGSAAPTGSATTGTVYFQTGSSAYTFVDRTDISGKSCTTSGTPLASFTLLPGLYLITYQFNCGTISSGTVRCDLKLGSVVKNQVRGASGHILSGSAIVQCIDSSSTITFTGYTTSGTSSSSEIHYSYVKLF